MSVKKAMAAAAHPGTNTTAWYESGNDGSKNIAPAVEARWTTPIPLIPYLSTLEFA